MIFFFVDFSLWLLYFLKGEGGWFYIVKKVDVVYIFKGIYINVF